MNPTDPTPLSTPSPLDSGRAPLDSWRTPLGAEWASTPPSTSALRRQMPWLAALLALLAVLVAAGLAVNRPWAGLQLGVVGDEVAVLAVHPGSPAATAGLRAGMRLHAVASPSGEASVVLEPADLVENPDQLPSYAAWARFYERQTTLARLWAGPLLRLQVQDVPGATPREVDLMPAGERPLGAMPTVFWFLLLVQAAGLLTAAWVGVAYPPQPAARYLASAALLLSIMLTCAAVFSGRELALPAGLFHALSVVNHMAAIGALLSLAGVMTYFPARLPGTRVGHLLAVAGCFALWALANALWWLPSPNWASRSMLLAGTALVFVQAVRQWRLSTAGTPARTVLRALALPWLLAALIGLQEGARMFGGTLLIAQAWLFGLILLATLGVALGLRGGRVFNVDDWATQALLSLGAGIGTLLSYRLIVDMQWLNEELAVLVAVLLFGITYVPLSSGVWMRSILRRGPSPRELTSGILGLGLAPPGERVQHWTNLLARTLQAHDVDVQAPGPETRLLTEPTVLVNGRLLWVPPVAGLPGVALWSRERGARAFSRSDRRLAQRLSELAAQTIEAREAYVRGATEERERIADDLHDDLGAKLLSLVHASGQADTAVTALAREALDEMRLSVRNLKAQPLPVADVVADWRAETVSRLTGAGIEVDWDAHLPADVRLLPVRASAQLTRVLREAVSNIIRHSGATHCRVLLQVTGSELQLEIEDNGCGLDTQAVAASLGHGLPNIERRVRRLGGAHRLATGGMGGVLLMVRLPLEPPPA